MLVEAAARRRAWPEIGCELIERRQRAPDEAKVEMSRQVGELRSSEFWHRIAGQNQTRHSPLHLRKTKRALMTSATQRSQRPLMAKLGSREPGFRKNSIFRGLLFAVGIALGGAGQNLLGDQARVLADRRLDLGGHVGIGFEERF